MHEIVLSQPPPSCYTLTVTLRDGADCEYLKRARIIIHSYLTPFEKVRMKRIKKGVHRYTLVVIDPVIDRSIKMTLENETWPHLEITKEETTCQETT